MTEPSTTDGVANLPFARGRVFRSLDEYLHFLESTNGAIGRPYWRQVERGVYQWTGRISGRPRVIETATRAELMERYGFSR